VTEHALAAGLELARAQDFVLAAHEVATNASKHGRPPVRAQTWTKGGELVCSVVDSGAGISDPLAGWVPPPPTTANGGWGLPIARQLCDVVEIIRRGAETIVSVRVALSRPRS
jgi:serine/threonine-protein kinase RsbW